MPLPRVSRVRTEQIVATSRLALVGASAFAVWLDPVGPPAFLGTAYVLHLAYGVYALGLLALAWARRPRAGSLGMATHLVDLVSSAVIVHLTSAPTSPFFIYFVFSMYAGALRWGWRGTVTTTVAVMVTYLALVGMTSAGNSAGVPLNLVVIRVIYLLMAGALLVYLGRYQERLRSEIERLARWPTNPGFDDARGTQAILEHATRIIDARQAMIVWDASEEPQVHVAEWSAHGLRLTDHGPAEWPAIAADALGDRIVFISGEVTADSSLLVSDEHGGLLERLPSTLPTPLVERFAGEGLTSAPFRTERLGGRVFFSGLGSRNPELGSLTAVVAREIGTWLDQRYVARQMQELAAREERLRVARDLHDGVLQSLTGIRLELRSVAQTLQDADQETRAKLFALERALSIEQRELRYFINGLKPGAGLVPSESLAGRLDALRERLSLEWNTPVTIRVSPELSDCPDALTQAIPLMVHEAVVNALKHAQPTRVSVTVEGATDRLRIVVADDGRGFPFEGHYDHRALDESSIAPRSLFDRVTALGGKMSIESSARGSRVEMVVSL